MPQHAFVFYSFHNGVTVFNLQWDQIFHDSIVVITASEGQPPISSAAPQLFVGDARYTVNNVSPFDGGVRFRVTVEWDEPINLWTTITVFDPSDPVVFASVPFPPPG
jgi:hypothetical protein